MLFRIQPPPHRKMSCTIPCGLINFLARAWVGKASDNKITESSGWLGILEPWDQIFADKGFQLSTLLAQRMCSVVMPPEDLLKVAC